MFRWLFLLVAAGALNAQSVPHLQNPGFEATASHAGQVSGWEVSSSPDAKGVVIQVDDAQVNEGSRSLRIDTKQPSDVKVSQELFLPAGSIWKASVWIKGAAVDSKLDNDQRGALEVETPAGNQGKASSPAGTFSWQREEINFRVPSPGRIRIALLSDYSGKLWFDDVRLEPLTLSQANDVYIKNSKLSQRPIDLKQGGQFIEPLCHMIPSMLAQQVESDSFEEETPCEPAYKRGIDWPNRPWYPDGAVHDATFYLDTSDPYNGKVSEKIELPVARARAGISQDGFYLKQGVGYRLHLHIKGAGHPRVWASLRGAGGLIAGPVLINHVEDTWQTAEVLLRAHRTIANATLTIEFEGPATLNLDRIYLIGEEAVLGLWKPEDRKSVV